MNGVNGRLDGLGRRINGSVLLCVCSIDHEVGVRYADKLLYYLIGKVDGKHRRYLLHHLVLVCDGRNRLVAEEVVAVLVAPEAVFLLVAVGVNLLQPAHILVLCTDILGSGVAELGGAHHLAHCRLDSLFGLAGLRNDYQVERVFGLRVDVLAVIYVSGGEGAVGILLHFREARVKHRGAEAYGVLLYKVEHVALHAVGHGFMLEHQLHNILPLLLVLVDDDDCLVVVGHGFVNHRNGVFRHFDAAEHFLYLLFGAVYVNVTNHNDGLVVRSVPLVVVRTQHLGLEVVDYFHSTDRHAPAVLAAGIQLFEVAFEHSLSCGRAQAPLLMDYSALLVNLLGVEGEAVGPVLEYEQARVQ